MNIIEITEAVNNFTVTHYVGLKNICKHFDNLSFDAYIAELKDELITAYFTYLNKHGTNQDIDTYLFYVANALAKKLSSITVKKKTQYICPGCMVLGQQNVLTFNKVFYCSVCEMRGDKLFAQHHKSGYHCRDCDRFIPHPLNNSPIVSCPYVDCLFIGEVASLKKMHHPTISIEVSVDNVDNISKADDLIDVKEGVDHAIKTLRSIIYEQMDNILYSSSQFTVVPKTTCYKAFLSLLESQPLEMIDYLLHESRSGGFQHLLFQEYIKHLEEAMPYSFIKNGKMYKISSLLDNELGFFDGISEFESKISPELEIKNGTKEFYIGGRKAAYTQPYFIGKLLHVMHAETKMSLMDHVAEYSFSKIKMKDIRSGIPVIVTHLRIPPHYQMGGMVYVNRLRKKIVDRAKKQQT